MIQDPYHIKRAALLAALSFPGFAGEDAPIKAVTLFGNGVGYVEHAAFRPQATLRVPVHALDDVLRTLTSNATVVSYIHPRKYSRIAKEMPWDLTQERSLPAIIEKLRGATVSVGVADSTIQGQLVACEQRTRQIADYGIEQRWWISIMTPQGEIRSWDLSDVRAIKIADPAVAQELQNALRMLWEGQAFTHTELRLASNNQAPVRIAYAMEMPVWKPTYRLSVPDGKNQQAQLECWAVISNTTAYDWENVSVTLVGGRPTTFRADVAAPIYLHRQELSVYDRQAIAPLVHVPGTPETSAHPPHADHAAPSASRRGKQRSLPSLLPMFGQGDEGDASATAIAEAEAVDKSDPSSSSSPGNDRSTSTDFPVYQYSIPALSVARDHSVTVPLFSAALSVEQVNVYNRMVHARHPLAGYRLRHVGEHAWPQGPLTMMHAGKYVGDAVMPDLSRGQERYITFAVEASIIVDSEKRLETQSQQIFRLVAGVAGIRTVLRKATVYAITNLREMPMTLLIEHPRTPGNWTAASANKPVDYTDTHWRYQLTVPPQNSVLFECAEENVLETTDVISNDYDEDRIALVLRNYHMSPAIKRALEQARTLLEQWQNIKRSIREIDDQIASAASDQQRLRENLAAVDRNSEYARRLQTRMEDLDQNILTLRARRQTIKEEGEQARRRLMQYLNSLNLE
ncbi:MAG: DUF4139 domain-containing protein [Rectinema sp.]|nr:DUF4139 domain-containing protein [Rectinema sp.]